MVKPHTLKWALRRAFSDVLPDSIISRSKHGFNVPIDHWLKNESQDLFDETFSDESALVKHRLLAKGAHKKAKQLLLDETKLHGHTLFCFVILNRWLEGVQLGNNC